MQCTTYLIALAALLAVCACAPQEGAIEKIPREHIPSATKDENVGSGAGAKVSGVGEVGKDVSRVRRDVGGQESDLLPSVGDVDASPFGGPAQVVGHGRIRVLPAFLG